MILGNISLFIMISLIKLLLWSCIIITVSFFLCSEQVNPAVTLPTPFRQLHWLYLCFSNSWLLLSPSALCVDWSGSTIPLIRSLSDVRNLATLATFATLLTLGVQMIKRDCRGGLFALSLLVIPFIPASNLFFVVGFVVAERVLYTPSMGLCLLISLLTWELMHKGKNWMRLIKPCLFFLLILYSTKTVLRNRDWYSEMTIWKSAVPINPENTKLYINLAHEYENINDTERVLRMLRQAADLDSRDMVTLVNLGHYHHELGRLEEAEMVSTCTYTCISFLLPVYIYTGDTTDVFLVYII